ncbi:MAG: hypothetical protein R2792_05805 [Saprospiraceae bacterium]
MAARQAYSRLHFAGCHPEGGAGGFLALATGFLDQEMKTGLLFRLDPAPVPYPLTKTSQH